MAALTRSVTIEISSSLYDKLDGLARVQGRTVADLILDAVEIIWEGKKSRPVFPARSPKKPEPDSEN